MKKLALLLTLLFSTVTAGDLNDFKEDVLENATPQSANGSTCTGLGKNAVVGCVSSLLNTKVKRGSKNGDSQEVPCCLAFAGGNNTLFSASTGGIIAPLDDLYGGSLDATLYYKGWNFALAADQMLEITPAGQYNKPLAFYTLRLGRNLLDEQNYFLAAGVGGMVERTSEYTPHVTLFCSYEYAKQFSIKIIPEVHIGQGDRGFLSMDARVGYGTRKMPIKPYIGYRFINRYDGTFQHLGRIGAIFIKL